jgi:hypothetical protein
MGSRRLTSVLLEVPARVDSCRDSSEQVLRTAGFCSSVAPTDGDKRGFDSRRLHNEVSCLARFSGGIRYLFATRSTERRGLARAEVGLV